MEEDPFTRGRITTAGQRPLPLRLRPPSWARYGKEFGKPFDVFGLLTPSEGQAELFGQFLLILLG